MRAITRPAKDKPPRLDSSHPVPQPSPTAYLVSTKATALTRGELTWPEPLEPEIPIPGYDLAGYIQQLPSESPTPSRFKTNDEIYALTAFHRQGNAREVSLALEEEMALKPRNMSFEEAATVPLSALSAWQALFVHGKLEANFTDRETLERSTMGKRRVLVTAASGGVGIWGVQLAHQAGAQVVGTSGPTNVDFVKSLGADMVLDYTKTDIADWVNEDRESRCFDIVLDCVGGETLVSAWKCARKGGTVISVAEPPVPKKPATGVEEGVEGVWFIVSPNGAQLARITQLIEEGRCKGCVDNVYKLEQWEEAFDRVEGGHARGKVVLQL
ncbi:NAD(P)-binding protein [Westerdykella ornata]|uniref:NAD(P)-binding protein n=1 Tax=Westerdykella ornata TaxID=318751 RepID=A0A6A6J897_WESOR|nr:NAD(P)-binding protein [Westerdykella ornata]KAF2272424.1 NAD(P)-binding protein [Westerdykella ornata]